MPPYGSQDVNDDERQQPIDQMQYALRDSLSRTRASLLSGQPAPGTDLKTAGVLALVDLVVSLTALGFGGSASKSLLVGYLVSGALTLVIVIRTRIRPIGHWPVLRSLCIFVVIAVWAYFLGAGVRGLLLDTWRWPSVLAVAVASALTGCVLQFAIGSATRPMWRAMDRCSDLHYWAFGIVCVSFALRAIYCAQIELLPEEAYYWNYSRHLDIGYLDHPPMVAWLIRAGTAAVGNNEFGVRLGALCCTLVASVFSYRLARNLFGEMAALFALVLVQTLPFFFLSGILMTPDAPLTAAWSAFLYFLERAVIGNRAKAWIWAGICLGVGLLSKYTIVLAGLAAFIYVVVDPVARRWLKRYEPYAGVLVAALLFSPVILWNLQHDWASFAFQTSRRLSERPQFALHKLIGSAIVLIAPVGFLTVMWMFLWGPAKAAMRHDDIQSAARWRLIQCSILTPLAVFAMFSLRHDVKVDWTGAPWVAALPMMAFGIVYWRRREAEGLRSRILRAWAPTIAVLLMIYATGFSYLATGLAGVGYSERMELAPVGWRELGRQIAGVARGIDAQEGTGLLIVGMDRYETASELAFYSADQVKSVGTTSAGHLFGGVGLMYEQWFPSRRQAASHLLLVSWNQNDLASDRLAPYVDRLGPLGVGTLERDGHFIRSYFYRLGYGYRHPP